MAIPESLNALLGQWHGTNHLWLSPEKPVRKSESTAEINTIAQGRFLAMHYTWAENGKPQDGLLVVGQNPTNKTVSASWVDSWHMQDAFMHLNGTVDSTGVVRVTGSYPAPPGPDWGWQIDLEPREANTFRFLMYNISPDGDRALAVEVLYSRQR